MAWTYIDVIALMTKEGKINPVKIEWIDGRDFYVDQYEKCGFAISNDGKLGSLYKVMIKGREKKIYLDGESMRWFVDLKD